MKEVTVADVLERERPLDVGNDPKKTPVTALVPQPNRGGQPCIVRNAPAEGILAGSKPRTIVACASAGAPAGLLAGLLQRLGVEFGHHVDDAGLDAEIAACVARVKAGAVPWQGAALRPLTKLLRRRRQRWGRFGFCCPGLGPHLASLENRISDPVFVFALRNPVVAALATPGAPLPIEPALAEAARRQFELATFAARTRHPVFLFGYEDAFVRPEALVDALSAFLGEHPAPVLRRRAITFIDRDSDFANVRPMHGHIEVAASYHVIGWVADQQDRERSLPIEVRIADETVATATADELRPDVKAAGYHTTGRCGFHVRLKAALTPQSADALSIHVPELGRALHARR